MPNINVLPITKDNILKLNDRFEIDVEGATLIFEVFYNQQGKFFSFNLYDENDDPIVLGRKITYGIDMIGNIIDDRLPTNARIIPLDKSGEAEKIGVTFDNFMESVLPLVIIDE